ncbi:hypothetical protein MUG94_11550 [Arthrobacter gengyunqii]|uniref:Spore protein YkvP/CgeB glycosyl transferase-like domain-containing protein n=1 Tax=Arthrobacter gengyunqii TaxID=2886940 RepID=A0A9X1LYJ0_9MICC|nr:hypothetical protein [Arthrobacter gengyunqii]MCC3267751.1 hypothetical protein [Arthrobacter gengyunqii]UOY95184.1 hypothetical protein MUG94_11550 [Arthrobacter gengyunqii]
MPHRDEQGDPSLPAPDGEQAEISYLASRLAWAEQQAAAYQRDYEDMLTAKNDLHRELSSANGSLRAFREENAALKQRAAAAPAPLTRRAKALARKLRGNTAATPATSMPGASAPAPAAASAEPEAPLAGYPVPPRTLSPAYTREPNRVLVVADSEEHLNAARRAAQRGSDVVVLFRPGFPWDTGQPFGYPRRICAEDPAGFVAVHSPDADIRAANPHHFVDRAADAIVREARLRRPAVLLADGGEATRLAVLVAGRRLGIAVAFEPAPDLPDSAVWDEEADADPVTLEALPGRTTAPLRALQDLHAGIICDEFTGRLLENSLHTTAVTPDGWQQQLDAEPWDALIVESAWLGNAGAWEVSDYYTDQKGYENLAAVVAACRSRGIPTVFWNKEDPIHYRRFRRVAGLFDHVLTTDHGSLPHYQENPRARGLTHSSLTFFADPALHNPLPGTAARETAVAYAGTYYGSRFPERSRQMLRLFASSHPHGPVIFDRHSNDPAARKAYPEELRDRIRGGLTYTETLEAYKAFPVHLNFNSAPWSETMFSRRVVEIAASGTVVYSADGQGIRSCLGDAFPVSADEDVYRAHLARWMGNEAARKTAAWAQLRTVYRAHLSGHALAVLFRTLGIPAAAPQPARAAVHVERLTGDTARELRGQSVRPALVLAETAEDAEADLLAQAGIPLERTRNADAEDLRQRGIDWICDWRPGQPRTLLEDLLSGAAFGDWQSIRIVRDTGEGWSPLAAVEPGPRPGPPYLGQLVHVDGASGNDADSHLTLIYPAGLI